MRRLTDSLREHEANALNAKLNSSLKSLQEFGKIDIFSKNLSANPPRCSRSCEKGTTNPIRTGLKRHSAFTLVELLVAIAIIGILITMMFPAIVATRESARRASCANNLAQIGVALQHYYSAHLSLPPGTLEEKGPIYNVPEGNHLGWIVHILPYIEENVAYKQIDFSSGAYSLKNMPVRQLPLTQLVCPSNASNTNHISTYAGCHNDIESPIDADNNGVFFLNSHVRDKDITDGLKHTIYVGEKLHSNWDLGWISGTCATLRNTGTPFNETSSDQGSRLRQVDIPDWAKGDEPLLLTTPFKKSEPEEESESPPPSKPLPRGPRDLKVGGFGSQHTSVTNVLFGDGRIEPVEKTIDMDIFQRLGNRHDGKLITSGPTRSRE